MTKRGGKCIVVDLSFDHIEESSKSGMLQFLEGLTKEPTIYPVDGIDTIFSGGICRYGNELICSERCQAYLNQLAKEYDWVIATSNSSPSLAETDNLLDLFKNAVITLDQETLDELHHCFKIAKNPSHHIMFLKV